MDLSDPPAPCQMLTPFTLRRPSPAAYSPTRRGWKRPESRVWLRGTSLHGVLGIEAVNTLTEAEPRDGIWFQISSGTAQGSQRLGGGHRKAVCPREKKNAADPWGLP